MTNSGHFLLGTAEAAVVSFLTAVWKYCLQTIVLTCIPVFHLFVSFSHI